MMIRFQSLQRASFFGCTIFKVVKFLEIRSLGRKHASISNFPGS
jgi:hypothetical protein